MSRRTPRSPAALLAPFGVIALYAWTLVGRFRGHVGWNLEVSNTDGLSPADVLPFGFFLPWTLFLAFFAIATAGALAVVDHRLRWAAILVAGFSACSVLDYVLFERVMDHML